MRRCMLRSIDNTSELKEYDFVSVEKYSEVSDIEIIQKILNGSIQLFEVLMRKYDQRLFRIQRSYFASLAMNIFSAYEIAAHIALRTTNTPKPRA